MDETEASQQTEYAVEAILEKRLVNKKVQYMVKWCNYEETTWESEENVSNCLELLAEFAEREAGKKILGERVLEKIFGLTDTGGEGLVFLAKFEDNELNELLKWKDAREYFSREVMDFFKSRVHWATEEGFDQDDDQPSADQNSTD